MATLKAIYLSLFSTLVFMSLTLTNAWADTIKVTLADPTWSFTLNNTLSNGKKGGRKNKISHDESKFIHQIQPLLSSKNYSAVIKEFEQFKQAQSGEVSVSLNELIGQVLLSAKHYEQAEKVMLSVNKVSPDSEIAHRSLSMVYMLKQDYKKAQKHLVKTIELGEIDAQIYGQLAFVNLQQGMAVTAISGYQNALLLEPNNKQWYQGLLYAYIQSNAIEQANNIVEEMLLLEPNNKQLWLQRGQIALKQGNEKRAISSLETAYAFGKSDVDNLITLAKLHITSGSSARAVEIVNQNSKAFTAKNNSNAFTTLTSIANYLTAKQSWDELSRLVSIIKKHSLTVSQQSQFKTVEAKLALAKGQRKQARKLLEQSIKHQPNSGEALIMLATIHKDEKNNQVANMFYLRAEALPKYKEVASLGRAQIAINQREYQQALDILRNVYKENSMRSDLISNIKSLENLLKNMG